MSRKAQGNLLIVVCALLWSWLGTFTHMLHVADGITVSAVTGLFTVILFLIAHRKHKFQFKNKLVLVTGVIYAVSNIAFFVANVNTTVTNAIVLQYTSPIFLLLITIFIAKYKPIKLEIAAVIVCFAGMVIFFADQLSGGQLFGNLTAVFSGLTLAFYFFLSNKEENDPVSVLIVTNTIQTLIGVIYFPLHPEAIPTTAHDWLILAILGFVLMGGASLAFAHGIQKTTALNANMIGLSEVFLAALWAHLIFHDTLGRFSAIGMIMMLAAIITETFVSSKVEEANAQASQKAMEDYAAEEIETEMGSEGADRKEI